MAGIRCVGVGRRSVGEGRTGGLDCVGEGKTEGLRKYPVKNFVRIVERSGASNRVKLPPGAPLYIARRNA